MVESDTEISKKLEKIFLQILEINEIDMNASIDDVPEWDSFGHVEIMMEIEKQFNIKIKVSDFPGMTSIPKILTKIFDYKHE